MKQFFRAVLTVVFSLTLFFGGLFLLGFIFLAALTSGGESTPVVAERSVLVFDLSVNLADTPTSDDPSEELVRRLLGGGGGETLSVRTATRALRAAAADSRISGLFLRGNLRSENYGSGFAALREVREAIGVFKAAGKPVHGYIDYAGNGDYYLLSTADRLTLNPLGAIGFTGLAMEGWFFRGLFEKYGIGVESVRVGRYKSAIEPFTRDRFSAEEREQSGRLLEVLWNEARDGVAAARGIDPARVQEWVDRGDVADPEEAVAKGLATRLGQLEDVLGDLRELAGGERDEPGFAQISLADYAATLPRLRDGARPRGEDRRSEVAIGYAEGVIVDGEGEAGQVGGSRFGRLLRRLREDDDVKALVLRINSPGGSALASEVVRAELEAFRKSGRPVIVSMGTVAASGGYWIATASDRIFVQPNTITGSIGVFGLLLNAGELANRQGVTFDTLKTGRFADLGSLTRRMQPEEMALLQRMVDTIYDQFVERVAAARKLPVEQVRELAEGRVWAGVDAVERGLADEVGGLQDAIEAAARTAGLPEGHRVTEHPRAQSLNEKLEELMNPPQPLARHARQDPVERVMVELGSQWRDLRSFNDPRGVYLRLPFEPNVR